MQADRVLKEAPSATRCFTYSQVCQPHKWNSVASPTTFPGKRGSIAFRPEGAIANLRNAPISGDNLSAAETKLNTLFSFSIKRHELIVIMQNYRRFAAVAVISSENAEISEKNSKLYGR